LVIRRSINPKLQEKKFVADAIHGDLQQREREKAMRAFKNHKIQLFSRNEAENVKSSWSP
jgi:superfamily II DNA/RNA helicase